MKKKKVNPSADEMLGAMLGAALVAGMAQADAEAEAENSIPSKALDRALELRKQYEAFVEVGFTEEQATTFIAAILS